MPLNLISFQSLLLSNVYPDLERYYYDVDRIVTVKVGNIFDGHLTYNFDGFTRLVTVKTNDFFVIF